MWHKLVTSKFNPLLRVLCVVVLVLLAIGAYSLYKFIWPTPYVAVSGQVSCDYPVRVRRLRPNGNNNEALCGVALFRTRLTLETYVTGALNPVKCSASCGRGSWMAGETPLSDVRFLTVAEVALIMRVSKMTVYRLVHSGELEAIRVGRSFRVPEQAVNQYLRTAFVGTS